MIQNTNLQEHPILAIASAISAGDKQVMEEIKKCLEDTESYFQEHAERFEERGVDDLEDVEDIEEIQWLAMVDALEENGYVCERDWDDELEDFLHFLGNLKGVSSNGLSIEADWFDEGEGITEWCTVLDEKWEAAVFCVAAIDIDSDSYVLFPCASDQLDELSELAESVECRIDLGQNM